MYFPIPYFPHLYLLFSSFKFYISSYGIVFFNNSLSQVFCKTMLYKLKRQIFLRIWRQFRFLNVRTCDNSRPSIPFMEINPGATIIRVDIQLLLLFLLLQFFSPMEKSRFKIFNYIISIHTETKPCFSIMFSIK